MFRKSLPSACFVFVMLSLIPANSSTHKKQAISLNSAAVNFWNEAVPYVPATFYAPSSPDNWRGGTGNWSNPGLWTAGLPGSSSDVSINTGNDYVTLDVSSSINSLTLGGSSGSSTLIDTSNGGYGINIAGALTVNQSGTLSLSFSDGISAGGNSTNAGTINLQAAGLQLANFSNTGTVNLITLVDSLANLSAGNLNNSGTISGTGYPYSDVEAASLNNSGSISSVLLSVSGSMTNSGQLLDSSFSVGGALTNTATGGIGVYWGGNAGSLNNAGEIDIIYNGLSVSGDALNSGQITVINQGDQIGASLGVNGTLTNTSSGSIAVGGSGLPWSGMGAGNLVNNGNIQLEGLAEVSINGNVTNSGTIATTNSSGIQNNGISVGGKFTNNAGATFQLLGTGDTATIANLVNLGGSVIVGNGSTLTVPVRAHAGGNPFVGFFNSGSVVIQQGSTVTSFADYTQSTGQTTVDGHLAGIINFGGGSVYGNGGTISGSVTSNASINFGDAPLTIGQLTFASNFSQGAHGNLTFDIAALNQYDQMNVTGQAHLNGMMTIDLLHGYIPQIGNMFDVMTFASESGTFSSVVGLPINNQEHFVLQYNSTNLTLDVVSGQLSGVSALDEPGKGEPYISWSEGSAYQSGGREWSPSETTPEPGSLLLFGSGLAAIVGLVRRKYST